MAVTVFYKGSSIATIGGGQTATLNCDGTEMKGDVLINVPQETETVTVGSFYLVDVSAVEYKMIVGMTWAQFVEVVGNAYGSFEVRDGYIYSYSHGRFLKDGDTGVNVLATDFIINGGRYS